MRLTILISDPWSLGEAIGWQPVSGELLQLAEDAQGGRALIKLDEGLLDDGLKWHYFIAQVRHRGDRFQALESGAVVLASLVAISAERAMSADAMDITNWRGGFAFMGEVRPQPAGANDYGHLARPE